MGTHTDRGDTQEEIHAQGQCTRDILDEWKNTATGFHINSGKYIHSLSFSLSLLYSYKLPPPLTHIIVILFSLSPYSVMPNACSCTSFVLHRNGIMSIPNSWNWNFPISMIVERMRMKNSDKSLRGKHCCMSIYSLNAFFTNLS